jgi:hypothetical protein
MLLDGRLEESRKWIGTKAAVVRSQFIEGSQVDDSIASCPSDDELEQMGVTFQRTDEEIEFGGDSPDTGDPASGNRYVLDPVILTAERVATASAVRETAGCYRQSRSDDPSET